MEQILGVKKRESFVGSLEKAEVNSTYDETIAIFTIRVHPKYWKNKRVAEYHEFITAEEWIINRLEGGKLFDIEYTYRQIKQGNQYR